MAVMAVVEAGFQAVAVEVEVQMDIGEVVEVVVEVVGKLTRISCFF